MGVMEAFDFNQFQRQIFREIFSDPLQKIPENETPNDVKYFVTKKKSIATKVVVKTAKKGRGRPKGETLNKKRIKEDADYSVENDQKASKKKKTLKKESNSRKDQSCKNICKTPLRVQTTAFEVHQKSAEIENSQKNVRRSLRAKLKQRKSVEVDIEIMEKEIHEISDQHEFLHLLGLKKT